MIKYSSGKKILRAFIAYTSETLYEYPLRCDSMVYYMNRKKLNIPFPECDDFKWVTIQEAKEILHETQVKVLQTIK